MNRKLDGGPLYRLYARRLRRRFDPESLPKHVAMIIDGNRRWAQQSGFSAAADGHRAGAAKVVHFLSWCDALGIETVTLYLLSGENLNNRGERELQDLVQIISDLALELSEHPNWRVQHVGATLMLPPHLVASLEAAWDRTRNSSGMHINLAVGYGGRSEITDAIRAIVSGYIEAGLSLSDLAERLTPELIGQHLYTGGQNDPDLVIRTSGEQRLSDFMLWQSAHSEFYFMEALGPDLREIDFLRALRVYAGRQRRYGG